MNDQISGIDLQPGAVVRMRERLWRIDRVVDTHTITATPLDGRDATSRPYSTLLESVKPDTMPFPGPKSVGPIPTQRLLLDAYRVSLIHGKAPIQGLQRSRAVPTEYQLVPLLKTIGQERVRLLIADDVGTGKTVEAGLVLAELAARGQVRRVLIAVPANLRDQWAEALDHFFHLEATVISGSTLPGLERRLLPGRSVWEAHDVVVGSIDYLKKRPEHVFAHSWDLVIIDESHLVARPHQINPSESDMQRWQFAQRAAAEVPHLILLTATPHNGYHDSYASLFQLVEPELVSKSVHGYSINRERAKDHVVQRRRSDIEAWYVEHGRPSPFPTLDQDDIIIKPGPKLQEMLTAIAAYSDRLYDASTPSSLNGWIAAHLQKRALSSPAALRASLRTRMATVRRDNALAGTKGILRDAKEHVADSLGGEDASDEERSTRVDLSKSTLDKSTELNLLQSALEAAVAVTVAQDTKLQQLFETLGGPKKSPGGRLSAHPHRQRVIVFTRFKDTLDYLVNALEKNKGTPTSLLPPDLQVFSIFGEMPLRARREEFARFERAQPAVMVATDCISEGLNLQGHCAEMIHYEVPYNPARLSQRNGRISRYGQPEPRVGIRLLVLDDPLDIGLMELVVQKARNMYEQYGFVPDFLANPDILYHLSHASNRARRLRNPTLFDAANELDTSDLIYADPFDPATMNQIVEQSFYGQEGVSLGKVQEALDATRAAVGGPEALQGFVDLALAFHGVSTKSDDEGMTFRLVGQHRDLGDLIGEGDQLYTFDPEIGMSEPDIDVVDLSHRLVRRLVDLTVERANVSDCEGRIAAVHTPAVEAVTGLCHVLARYVAASEPPVLLEELVPVSLPVFGEHQVRSGDALINAEVGRGTRTTHEITEDAQALLSRADLRSRIDDAIEARRRGIATDYSELAYPWSQGLDQVEVASWDLTAITMYYPSAPA